MDGETSRVNRTKQEARISYNRMSRWYDFFAGTSERKFMEIGINQLLPQPGEQILEIGCGTGHGLLSLANSVGPSGCIFGLDISEGMLTQSSVRIRKFDFQNLISLQQGDGCLLPYISNSFSAVLMSFTIELFDTPDIPLVLMECRRVLKKEGRIVLVCLAKKESLIVRIYEWFHKIFPSFVDCRPINIQSYIPQTAFNVTNSSIKSMWGLPVEIVTAVVMEEKMEAANGE
ncbi:MAG: methyltransferase domain-containing protein [Chloroflexota bacterium]